MFILLKLLNLSYSILSMAIVIRCLVSWIPGFNMYSSAGRILSKLTDWILEPIQDVLSRLNLLTVVDVSPVIALFLLRLGYRLILTVLYF